MSAPLIFPSPLKSKTDKHFGSFDSQQPRKAPRSEPLIIPSQFQSPFLQLEELEPLTLDELDGLSTVQALSKRPISAPLI